MSPPAAGLAVLLHAAVAALLLWAPVHQPTESADEPIEVTMEAPPPPPEPKPEPKPAPEAPKPPPPAPKAPPKPAQNIPQPGLAPQGVVGDKDTHPKMELGQPSSLPPPSAEQAPDEKPVTPPPEQAMAKPAEPPPPPQPTLEKELPPVEAPLAPLTSRDIPKIAPPVPEKKLEASRPPQPQVQTARPAPPPPSPQQLPQSPLSRLQRNTPPQRQTEQPRTSFINPADTYAMNTVSTSYQHRVVAQIARYQADLQGVEINDFVVARFTIARNGALLGISILSSSGKRNLDRGLITAFQQVAPFPPLPSELPGDSATFTLTFGPRYQQR